MGRTRNKVISMAARFSFGYLGGCLSSPEAVFGARGGDRNGKASRR